MSERRELIMGAGGVTGSAIRDVDDLVRLLGVPYTDEQLAAITAPLEPAVIVAGAGSGKTTVMAARVVWLVGTGAVAPDGVLGLTFTNKAAAELAGRVRAALERAGVVTGVAGAHPACAERGVDPDADPGEPTVSTYHSYAGVLIESHGLRLGVEPHSRLLVDATRYQLAARVIGRARGPFPSLTKPTGDLVSDLLALDAEVSEHLVTLDQVRTHDRALLQSLAGHRGADSASSGVGKAILAATRRLELVDLVADYRAAKAERDLLDFGDQIALAARLAESDPAVGVAERGRFEVVLLDEYQDTSVAQRRMLVGLFAGHPVTAVGDPCQAIYGWRGASVANLEEFAAHFADPARPQPVRRFTLRENRRNGERVLELANVLAAPLRAVHTGVAPLVAARAGGEIRTALLADHRQELTWVGEQVAAAIAEGTAPGEIAVLVRATRDIGPLHAELVARRIPVEVVGLGGLVHLPEVADIIATLEVIDCATANAALVRLLAGPRWRIGARDLALLGRRAAELVAVPRDQGAGADAMATAVGISDPAELIALPDALADPGAHPFSAAARARFAALEAELRALRRHVGEPLIDLLHRVIATTGLDVEIAAGPHAHAARRRESLATFCDVAADFADADGDHSVAAFLAYLRAAEEHERGLDSATPGDTDSVTLMTAHKAKGLEWDVVVLPDVTATVFPSSRGRAKWTTRAESLPQALRGDREHLPALAGWSPKEVAAFEDAVREQSALEELRLAYVACTRPRRRLVASGHWWGPTQKKPRGPSEYLRAIRSFTDAAGLDPGGPWAGEPEPGTANPLRGEVVEIAWPAHLDPEPFARRRASADGVRVAIAARASTPGAPVPTHPDLSAAELERVRGWDRDLELLQVEAARARYGTRSVVLPASLSASQVLALARDPDALARDLIRPMPRPPGVAARRGTRFHAWVADRFGQQVLLADDLLDAVDDDVDADPGLTQLQAAFLAGPYADLRPHAIEAPFSLPLGGRIIRGRIDAVYLTASGFDVIDWKTGVSGESRADFAGPLQLAIYRLAWAELAGVDPGQVGAAFVHVRTGAVERPLLPSRTELEHLLTERVVI
ncbi:MAG: UvrD-helicase domain-containing protein [Sporichthyaceae bacterium]